MFAPDARRDAHGRQQATGEQRTPVGEHQQADPRHAGGKRERIVGHARDVLKEQRMQAHQREDRHPGRKCRHQAREGAGKQHERSRDEQQVHRPDRVDRLERMCRFQRAPDGQGQYVGERRMLRLIQSRRGRRWSIRAGGRRRRIPVVGVGQRAPLLQLLASRWRVGHGDHQRTEGEGHPGRFVERRESCPFDRDRRCSRDAGIRPTLRTAETPHRYSGPRARKAVINKPATSHQARDRVRSRGAVGPTVDSYLDAGAVSDCCISARVIAPD